MPSLYRRILGEALDELPASLRDFHDDPEGGCARGSFRVYRQDSWWARALGRCLRLPPAGEAVSVVLTVEVEGERERWIRRFGEHRLDTLQEVRGTRLVERVGWARLHYDLAVEKDALVYDLAQVRILGLPVPRFSRPRDRTMERGTAEGWDLLVHVALPLLGELVRYEGRLVWEESTA